MALNTDLDVYSTQQKVSPSEHNKLNFSYLEWKCYYHLLRENAKSSDKAPFNVPAPSLLE